jgi:hypothetical protein
VLVPTVVVEVFLGILIGPDVFDLTELDSFLLWDEASSVDAPREVPLRPTTKPADT